MRKYFIYAASLLLLSTSCSTKTEQQPKQHENLVQYVDQYIGSDYHGHVFLGANVPFGMVQLGPTNISQGWDWCSGYHYSDSTIIGFAHTHLSGTGIGDLGDISVLPIVGEVKQTKGTANDLASGYTSTFKRENERVAPGYYSVVLDRYNVKAELTTTSRVGVHRYTFPKSDASHILFDLGEGIGWDRPVETFVKQVSPTKIEGYRFSTGWAVDQKIYFVAEFSKPMKSFDVMTVDASYTMEEGGKKVTSVVPLNKGVANFDTEDNEAVVVKVGMSYVSTENAAANMQAEMTDFDFDRVAQNASDAWNNQLNRIAVEGKNKSDIRSFYTALYHSMIFPSTFSDVNGQYRGADGNVHTSTFPTYSVFSLWDTYRAAHPLYTIIAPEKVNDFVNTFLDIYKQQGKLPVWHLVGNETDCMVGYPAFSVIAEAYLKGFRDYDANLALEAMKSFTQRDERGLKEILEYGYFPSDVETESVAKALEYGVSDWGAAQMAKEMGNEAEYKYFFDRSKGYANYFDQEIMFMRGKDTKGQWRTPFDPVKSLHRADDFCEGNSWQYTWLVPQDVEGLVSLFGSEERFINKLDSLFSISSDLGEGASSDITGLIGQYAHGNEPSHHVTYLYAYVGQQWKTAARVRQITKELYFDLPDGLCGNEDCGQMSAWYVFNALGFYPVNPSSCMYVFGSPLFDHVKFEVNDGKTFEVITHNNSDKNMYIQSVKLNGKPYTKSYIIHNDIMNGGTLEFEMGPEPNKSFGAAPEDRPQSKVYR